MFRLLVFAASLFLIFVMANRVMAQPENNQLIQARERIIHTLRVPAEGKEEVHRKI